MRGVKYQNPVTLPRAKFGGNPRLSARDRAAHTSFPRRSLGTRESQRSKAMKRECAEFEQKIAMAAKVGAMPWAVSGWRHLRWEEKPIFCERLGTLGTVGTLARFLEKYARFSRVPNSANGTLEAERKHNIRTEARRGREKRSR